MQVWFESKRGIYPRKILVTKDRKSSVLSLHILHKRRAVLTKDIEEIPTRSSTSPEGRGSNYSGFIR